MIQPGTVDGGVSTGADDIGTLDASKDIVFTTSANNEIDAAIALSDTTLLGNATPADGYGTPKSMTIAPALNMKVKKYGRTTGQTSGRITAINVTLNVGYDSGVARFVNQIIIEPGSFSAGGDSGSLIVADGKGRNKGDDRKPVGLLFAGSCVPIVSLRKGRPIPLSAIPYGSDEWKRLYRGRASVERECGRLKHDYGLAPLRVRGLERVALHADLVMLARLSQALARVRAVPLEA